MDITLLTVLFYVRPVLLVRVITPCMKKTIRQKELQIKEDAIEVNVLSWVWILYKATSRLF
jgi:hypothetical protein